MWVKELFTKYEDLSLIHGNCMIEKERGKIIKSEKSLHYHLKPKKWTPVFV